MNSQKPIRGVQINKTHPLSKGLVGCWLFNEATGETVFDLSGNGNNGTLENGVAWGSDGLEFDGVDDYVDCESGSSLDLGTIGSLAFWFKPDALFNSSTVQNDTLLARYQDNDYGVHIILTGTEFASGNPTDGSLHMKIESGGGVYVYVDTNIVSWNAEQWYHAVFTRNGSSYKVYIDGIDDTSAVVGSNTDIVTFNNTANWYIGGGTAESVATAHTRYFNGSIDSVRVYNRALSADEIAWSYREPYAMFDKPLSPALLYAAAAAGAENPYWYYEMLRRRNR